MPEKVDSAPASSGKPNSMTMSSYSKSLHFESQLGHILEEDQLWNQTSEDLTTNKIKDIL